MPLIILNLSAEKMSVPGCNQCPQGEAACAGAPSAFPRLRLSAGDTAPHSGPLRRRPPRSAVGLSCWRRMRDSTCFSEERQPALWAFLEDLPLVSRCAEALPPVRAALGPAGQPLSSSSPNAVRPRTHLCICGTHLQPFVYHELKWNNCQSVFDACLHITFSSLKLWLLCISYYGYFLFLKNICPLK